jgi:hypothetical protein
MLVLKRDLPFAKKGSEVVKQYADDSKSSYSYYVANKKGALLWIGFSYMDLSEWIEVEEEGLNKHTAKIVELFEKQQKEIEFIKKNLTQRILYDKENSTYDKSAYALLDNIESQIERLESLQDKQHDNLIEKIENLKCYKKK